MTLRPLILALFAAGLGATAPLLHAEEAPATAPAAPAAPAADSVLIKVNGTPITQGDFDKFVADNNLQGAAEAQKQMLLDELVARELVYQEAMARGLDQNEEYKATLAKVARDLLIKGRMQEFLIEHQVPEAEVQAFYDEQAPQLAKQEYKARHILLKSEDDARSVITKLGNGTDFAELAKEVSTGPSGPNGGDLGWFGEGQMVPEFTAEVKRLKPGEYSKVPVKTQFGWHVVKLEEVRAVPAPSIDELRPKIQEHLRKQMLVKHLDELRAKATLE